jgi:hypothetical protein
MAKPVAQYNHWTLPLFVVASTSWSIFICNYVACRNFWHIFGFIFTGMHRFRSHIAWIMLLATFAIALPRTWVHDCDQDQHQQQGDAGSHDQIDHENCPICDYAPASPFAHTQVIQLAAPTEFAVEATPFTSLLSSSQVQLCSLRGPPIA